MRKNKLRPPADRPAGAASDSQATRPLPAAALNRPTGNEAPEFLLEHPAGIRIVRTLKESDLVAFGPPKPDSHNIWMWYSLPPFKDGQVLMHIQLGYKAGKLEVISLSNIDPQYGCSPCEWSESKERARAESLKMWLAAKGLPPGKYKWGTISVVFDEKAGGGSAGVEFSA